MDKLVKHEFLDRPYMLGMIFHDHMAEHPHIGELPEEIENRLGELYQKMANI